MSKYKILGLINLILIAFFVFILATSTHSKGSPTSLYSIFRDYSPGGIILFSILMNGSLARELLFKKTQKMQYRLFIVLTFSSLLWFLLLFIGYFFASSVFLPILSIFISIFIYHSAHKSSKKVAIILLCATLLVSSLAIISGFEEDYCSGKGVQADSTGSKMVTATKEDVIALKDFRVQEGAQIGVNFKTHMECHNTFKFSKALEEKYFFQFI